MEKEKGIGNRESENQSKYRATTRIFLDYDLYTQADAYTSKEKGITMSWLGRLAFIRYMKKQLKSSEKSNELILKHKIVPKGFRVKKEKKKKKSPKKKKIKSVSKKKPRTKKIIAAPDNGVIDQKSITNSIQTIPDQKMADTIIVAPDSTVIDIQDVAPEQKEVAIPVQNVFPQENEIIIPTEEYTVPDQADHIIDPIATQITEDLSSFTSTPIQQQIIVDPNQSGLISPTNSPQE